MDEKSDPVVLRHRDLEQIAITALEAGRLLMETGARCEVVRQGVEKVAMGLGAQSVHIRIGFASLSLTVSDGQLTSTRMLGVGHHGVNMRLNHEIRAICSSVRKGLLDRAATLAALADRVRSTPKIPRPVNALAAGLACMAFGRLLGTDWPAFFPVLAAATIGQYIRLMLITKGVNAFVITGLIAFLSATLAGFSAVWLGSQSVDVAMSAAVLMLVPGVPAMNAQTDIMEGFPTLGSARFVSVTMVLVFLTVGVAAAHIAVGASANSYHIHHSVLHQTLFGAIAAAGFGVLFNFGPITLLWAGVAGAVALAVRTVCLDFGWPLEAASFLAAATVAVCVDLLEDAPAQIRRAGNALAVAGCIPMIPGSAAAHCIIGLLDLTAQNPDAPKETLVMAVSSGLQVVFTIGAIGAGLTIVSSLFRKPDFPE